MLQRKISIGVLILFSAFAKASQVVTVLNDGEAIVQIAQSSLNRIYVKEDRIAQITSLNGELMVQKDLEQGQLFVKPIDEQREKSIEIFISTEKNKNFSLSLKPTNIKAQNIGIYLDEEQNSKLREEENILSFIKVLYQKPYKIEEKDLKLSEKTSAGTYRLIKGEGLQKGRYIGEIYLIENPNHKFVRISHRPFWQKGVKAVAIEKNSLIQGEATKVFVVKINE